MFPVATHLYQAALRSEVLGHPSSRRKTCLLFCLDLSSRQDSEVAWSATGNGSPSRKGLNPATYSSDEWMVGCFDGVPTRSLMNVGLSNLSSAASGTAYVKQLWRLG